MSDTQDLFDAQTKFEIVHKTWQTTWTLFLTFATWFLSLHAASIGLTYSSKDILLHVLVTSVLIAIASTIGLCVAIVMLRYDAALRRRMRFLLNSQDDGLIFADNFHGLGVWAVIGTTFLVFFSWCAAPFIVR